MSLTDITKASVLAAVEECDRLRLFSRGALQVLLDPDDAGLAGFQGRERWALRRVAVGDACPVASRRNGDAMPRTEFPEAAIRKEVLFAELVDGLGPDLFVELVTLDGDGVI